MEQLAMQEAVLHQRVATTSTSSYRWRRFAERQLPYFILSLLILGLLLAIVYPAAVYNIPPGHLGVLWLRFDNCEHPTISCGTVLDPKELRYEGMHFIAPWNKLYIYDRRLKATDEIYDAISSDGVQLHATVTVRQQ